MIATSRRYRKKIETRERILAAGIQIFSEKGIEQATVDEIAAAADVGKGTIYNYFETKEDIVVAFLVDIERKVQQEVGQLISRRGTLESVLVAFLRFQFKLKESHHPFVRVFLAQMFSRATAFSPWIQQLQTVIDPPLYQLFSALQERGLMRPDVQVRDLVPIFKVIHLGLTALWAMEGSPWRQTERILKEEIRLFCKGLEARGA